MSLTDLLAPLAPAAPAPAGAARPPQTPAGPRRRPRPSTLAPLALAALLAASLGALTAVIAPAAWLALGAVLAAAVLATGFFARLARAPWPIVLVAQLVVLTGTATALLAGPTAIAGVVPTLDTWRFVGDAAGAAAIQLRDGIAPVDADAGLSVVLALAAGLLAFLLDAAAVTARLPLVAIAPPIAIVAIPGVIAGTEPPLVAVVVVLIATALLLRAEARARLRRRGIRPPVLGPATPVVAAVTVVSIGVSLAVSPALSGSEGVVTRSGTGIVGTAISPSLELGENLRQPAPIEVARVWGDIDDAPYLRALTLSSFTGERWVADSPRTEPLAEDGAIAPPVYGPGIAVEDQTASIEVTNLRSPWLPVPFETVALEGVEGEWGVDRARGTVSSSGEGAGGQAYAATFRRPAVSVERIREAGADLPGYTAEELLQGDPMQMVRLGEIAQEQTAGATTPYDAAIALQRWFRSDFDYSLDTPVESGFDGTDLDAVLTFLDAREGYCIHFATAFALMARALEMPSRIVVGYLPGAPTPDRIDDQVVYSVLSTQLHAWPEVYFDDIGWVPFEPTATLGTPTTFRSEAAIGGSAAPGQTEGGADPADPASPAPGLGTEPSFAPEPGEASPSAPGAGGPDPTPLLVAVAVLLVALLAPAAARGALRRARLRRARAGGGAGALAAWRELRALAVDVGRGPATGESPRAFGARLVAEASAPADAVDAVVGAIEAASYAPAGGGAIEGPVLVSALGRARAGMLEAAAARRATIALLPASLFSPAVWAEERMPFTAAARGRS